MSEVNETPTSVTESPDELGVQGDGEPVKAEAAEGEEGEQDHEEGKKKPGGFQKRISKLTNKLAEKDAIIERLLTERQAPKAEPEPKKAPEGKPRPDDFDSHADYVEALTDYKVREADRAREAREAAKREEASAKEAQERWQAAEEKALERYEDYDDVVDFVAMQRRGLLNQNIANFVMESDFGPDLLYHLASNPEEAKRIAGLRPTRAAAELGRLEGRLEAQAKPKTPETKPKTSAPAPINPVGAKGAVAVADEKLSDAEWLAKIRRR